MNDENRTIVDVDRHPIFGAMRFAYSTLRYMRLYGMT